MILIVDDVPINTMIIKILLKKLKFNSEEINDSEKVIEKVKAGNHYDFIFMDLEMPKLDGITCTKILRNELNYQGVIVAITCHKDRTEECLQAGINKVLSKPISIEKLSDVLQEFS